MLATVARRLRARSGAGRLMEADVPVTVRHVPGAWHLFEAYAPESELARATTAHWLADLREALSAPERG
ncbi:alpha/beta hydrolase family protein [Actinomadura logoneensis]|uniref:hypothetical protein n=1 Tax=Actinomadura logoneensis TaxID=2293572 RepID=UPI0018F13F9B|nr:hypothetical protein [Actinomadura logoneensis]